MIYLASPYSHEDPAIRQERFTQVETLTTQMLVDGVVVFSPIVYAHELAKKGNLPTDAAFWQNFNIEFLRHASGLAVMKLPGWETSRGVQWEISIAEALHIPITYIEVSIANY